MTLLRLAGRRTFASLRRHRNYRLFFAGQITSVCGTWMQNIAMAWLVSRLERLEPEEREDIERSIDALERLLGDE